jgi:hypothetical protein
LVVKRILWPQSHTIRDGGIGAIYFSAPRH